MPRPQGHPDNPVIAQLASHERWAKVNDRTAETATARKTFQDSFIAKARERFGDLPPAELERRAASLRKAHYSRMALRSAQAKRAKRAKRQAAENE